MGIGIRAQCFLKFQNPVSIKFDERNIRVLELDEEIQD